MNDVGVVGAAQLAERQRQEGDVLLAITKRRTWDAATAESVSPALPYEPNTGQGKGHGTFR
jgi:hypothetical protein